MNLTIKDIAELAGVSKSTVSRVINNTANVASDKRDRVLNVIRETGFKPNDIAKSLYKKSSRLIGYIVPSISNPFFNEICRVIEDVAFKNGYKLIVCNSDDDAGKEIEYIGMLSRMNADGIILTTNNNELYSDSRLINKPFVVIDRSNENFINTVSVRADHYNGSKMATEYLIQRGCENLIHMRGPQVHSSSYLRWKGFYDTCTKNNIKPLYMECKYNFYCALEATKKMISMYPQIDGIVAGNDMHAVSIYKAITKLNIKVPEDIKIIGYDGISLSELVTPEITTIAQPIKDIGRIATEVLLDIISGKVSSQKEIILPVKLIVRETT